MVKSVYEEITSLYLRLNGFFVNVNYVVEREKGQSQEIDIVAYRLANAVERFRVGNEYVKFDPDYKLFETINEELCGKESDLRLDARVVDLGVISEVKGEEGANGVCEAFSQRKN